MSPAYAATEPPEDSISVGVLSSLFDFVKSIFIPAPEYFANKVQSLNRLVRLKLGGIGDLYNIAANFFGSLSASTAVTPLTFSIPDNFFFDGFSGFSVDMLTAARPYINILRGVFDSFVCLVTGFFCYKRLTALFDV